MTKTAHNLYWLPGHPDTTGWKDRHTAALKAPRGPETGVVVMLRGWLDYADHFDGTLGEDAVLGPEWAAIGAAIRGLLNGNTGRLDCGTLDAIICNTLTAEGFDPENL